MLQHAELLECRRLLASSITVNGLDVNVVGTDGAETIIVSVTGNNYPYTKSAWIEFNGNRLTRLDPAKAEDYRFHIWGKGGDDRIEVQAGFGTVPEAVVYGGRGNDTIRCSGRVLRTVIYGDGGADTIQLLTNSGGNAATVLGGAGRDIIIGGDSDAFIDCGPGNDRVWGGAGNETIYGQEGNDVILGQDGNDCLYGGPGNDLIAGGNGDDRLFGNEGSDTLIGEAGSNVLRPGPDRGLLYPAFATRKLRLLIESLLAARP